MKPIAERPLPDQTEFLGVVVGMAKDAGYTLTGFCELIKVCWPYVKPPHDRPWWSVTFACGHSFTGVVPREQPSVCPKCGWTP